MIKNLFIKLYLIGVVFLLSTCGVPNKDLEVNINWEEFLGRHDLVWDKVPDTWKEGAFMGNGRQALSMFKEPKLNALRFAVDNDDVYDKRDDSYGCTPYSRARYRVGDFQLHPIGKITGMDLRQDIYNAELRGTLFTEAGQITFRAFVHTEDPVMIIEIDPSEGEKGCQWVWKPYEAITSRWGLPKTKELAVKYKEFYGQPAQVWEENPEPEIIKQDDINLCIQKLFVGGGYTTAWKEVTEGSKRTLYCSPVMSYPELTSPVEAAAAVTSAQEIGVDKLFSTHREWWNNFYKSSFISFTDSHLESFYWIQMYKYASIARENTQVIDTHGPWLHNKEDGKVAGRPYSTWDLNTQISYWALQPSNHLDIAESLFKNLDDNFNQLIKNVRPVEYQTDAAFMGLMGQNDLNSVRTADMRWEDQWGNLPWLCHNYWLQYRFSMDESMLRDRVYPLLRRAINFYMHYVFIGEDGKYHLPSTNSPEFSSGPDTNYDLSLLKWSCQTLVEICAKFNITDPNLKKWKDVAERLVDFPQNETGFMVNAERSFDIPHRHHSHLMMIYPLFLVNWENENEREIIKKSLDNWQGFDTGMAGYSFTIGSSIASLMRDGNLAREYFKGYEKQMFTNTMYAEGSQNTETPLAAAQSINDMLIQSWGDKIRVFPAIPDAWPDVVIHDMRTEGAFLVSAKRENGATTFVRIKSLKGAPCKVAPGFEGDLKIIGKRDFEIKESKKGIYTIDLIEGEEIVLYQGNKIPDLSISSVSTTTDQMNSFGARKK